MSFEVKTVKMEDGVGVEICGMPINEGDVDYLVCAIPILMRAMVSTVKLKMAKCGMEVNDLNAPKLAENGVTVALEKGVPFLLKMIKARNDLGDTPEARNQVVESFRQPWYDTIDEISDTVMASVSPLN
jgi:hypothetical protein